MTHALPLRSPCGAAAVARMFWSGSAPIDVCAECLRRALEIAQAMGFYLHTEATRTGSCAQLLEQ